MDLQPTENQEQEKVSLCCRADNYTYESLRWYRLDPQALPDEQARPGELDCRSVHQYALTLDSELSFQESSNSWILNFTMLSIRLQDEGHYVCEAQRRRSGEKQCLFRYVSVKGETGADVGYSPGGCGVTKVQLEKQAEENGGMGLMWKRRDPHDAQETPTPVSISTRWSWILTEGLTDSCRGL